MQLVRYHWLAFGDQSLVFRSRTEIYTSSGAPRFLLCGGHKWLTIVCGAPQFSGVGGVAEFGFYKESTGTIVTCTELLKTTF